MSALVVIMTSRTPLTQKQQVPSPPCIRTMGPSTKPTKEAMRKRVARLAESTASKEERLRKQRVRRAKQKASEPPEKRLLRLAEDRTRVARRRAKAEASKLLLLHIDHTLAVAKAISGLTKPRHTVHALLPEACSAYLKAACDLADAGAITTLGGALCKPLAFVHQKPTAVWLSREAATEVLRYACMHARLPSRAWRGVIRVHHGVWYGMAW